MIVGMLDYALSPDQLAELRQAHRCTRHKREASRIKAVVLLATGWTAEAVAEVLLVDPNTVRAHFKRYGKRGLECLRRVGGRMRRALCTSMPDQEQCCYLSAAIDRATRWIYVEILKDKSATAASDFLARLIDKALFTISKVLTDNGKEFTDRFCATGEHQPTGARSGLYRQPHRAPAHQTDGMVECFNGRIAEFWPPPASTPPST